jgi:hypothetical protein
MTNKTLFLTPPPALQRREPNCYGKIKPGSPWAKHFPTGFLPVTEGAPHLVGLEGLALEKVFFLRHEAVDRDTLIAVARMVSRKQPGATARDVFGDLVIGRRIAIRMIHLEGVIDVINVCVTSHTANSTPLHS